MANDDIPTTTTKIDKKNLHGSAAAGPGRKVVQPPNGLFERAQQVRPVSHQGIEWGQTTTRRRRRKAYH